MWIGILQFAIIGICNLTDFIFGHLTIFFSVAESMELAEACWPGCGAAKWYKDVASKSQRANSTWMWSTLASIGGGDDSSLSNQCWRSELPLRSIVLTCIIICSICFRMFLPVCGPCSCSLDLWIGFSCQQSQQIAWSEIFLLNIKWRMSNHL